MVGLVIGLIYISWLTERILSESNEKTHMELLIQMDLKVLAEKRAVEAESRLKANVSAIEESALPWVAKNDRLEARFEADAIDEMENPHMSWDHVPGLGGLK